MAKIDAFFQLMHDQGASDLHLVSGQQPVLRIRGEMERIKFEVLENDELKAILYEITPEHKIKQFEETGDVDFAYEIPGLARYRANFFQQKFGVAAVFREIPSKITDLQELGLPSVIAKLASLPRGLVLVTGPTGSGKSTTLAAIIDEANRTRKDHIITIEDPIEFVHKSQSCIVNHREVGLHTKSFSAALRGALREDPDIILVGEMRDLETISLAVEAASTGHLVFATLHTTAPPRRSTGSSRFSRRGADADPLHAGRWHPGGHFPGSLQAGGQEGALRRPGDPDRQLGGAESDQGIQDLPDPFHDPDGQKIWHATAGRRHHGTFQQGMDQRRRCVHEGQR